MRVIIFTFFVTLGFISASATTPEIPSKFLGSWSVTHSENFDEYLSAKGYGFFTRQLAKLAKLTKIITKKSNGLYNYKIESTKKNVEWDNFAPNTEFQGEYIDDTQHKIKIWYDENTDKLIEKHISVEDPTSIDVYDYKIAPDGNLVMHMEYKGVGCTRYYKKNT